jgi:hypothetical protein
LKPAKALQGYDAPGHDLGGCRQQGLIVNSEFVTQWSEQT